MVDGVGRALQEVISELDAKDRRYEVEYTVPTRDYFKVDENIFYVIRQKIKEDGSYQLTAAAKMRKEV